LETIYSIIGAIAPWPTVAVGLVLPVFSAWKALKGKAHAWHWRISALLLWMGVLYWATAILASPGLDKDGVLQEPFFGLIPVGFFFYVPGILTVVLRAVLNLLHAGKAKP
jgi:hypothetical protein